MNYRTIIVIRNNPNIERYLMENSFWYKELNRNPESINIMINRMKENYHLNVESRIEDFGKKIELLSNFINILK